MYTFVQLHITLHLTAILLNHIRNCIVNSEVCSSLPITVQFSVKREVHDTKTYSSTHSNCIYIFSIRTKTEFRLVPNQSERNLLLQFKFGLT